MVCRLTLLLLLTAPVLAGAQVQHNFEMGPENTDCARLDSLEEVTEFELLEAVKASSFRFVEEMQISRYSAPRKLTFASCDGKMGYLLAWQDDTESMVYVNVPMKTWEAIRDAPDPRQAFREEELQRYQQKKAP